MQKCVFLNHKCKGLVTNYGEGEGIQNWRGGGSREVLLLRKGGGTEHVLAMRKRGGGRKSFGVVLRRELKVLAILKREVQKKTSLFKRWEGVRIFILSCLDQ